MGSSDQPGFTPDIDPGTPLPDLGTERVSAARFQGEADSALEWQRLWRKVWNPGPREEELPEPGDHVIHQLGKESLLFVRSEDGVVRGFYNVCQHRGNVLVSDRRFYRHGPQPSGAIGNEPGLQRVFNVKRATQCFHPPPRREMRQQS